MSREKIAGCSAPAKRSNRPEHGSADHWKERSQSQSAHRAGFERIPLIHLCRQANKNPSQRPYSGTRIFGHAEGSMPLDPAVGLRHNGEAFHQLARELIRQQPPAPVPRIGARAIHPRATIETKEILGGNDRRIGD